VGYGEYKKMLSPIHGDKQTVTLKNQNNEIHVSSYNAAIEKNFSDSGAFASWDGSVLCERLELDGTTLDDLGRALRGEGPPTSGEKRAKRRLDDTKWFLTKWLEVWLADVLVGATDDTGRPLFDEVRQSVEGKEGFEVDVVAVRGYTAFAFSCTTGASKGLVKEKLFEAHQRARQIGGEHARFATVSMSMDPQGVAKEVKRNWKGYGESRCFGHEHIFATDAPKGLLDEVRRWVLREGAGS
jgi:hypothetical protein